MFTYHHPLPLAHPLRPRNFSPSQAQVIAWFCFKQALQRPVALCRVQNYSHGLLRAVALCRVQNYSHGLLRGEVCVPGKAGPLRWSFY